MKVLIPTLVAGFTASPLLAQASVEDFESGNPDGWEVWFSTYNSIQPTGGNPGAYLELDDLTSGPATCQFLEIFPAGDPGAMSHAHSGNWRNAGVDSVSVDFNVFQTSSSIGVGDVSLELTSDPGTPGDPSDDCTIRVALVGVSATTPGWQTYVFDVPSSQMFLPATWEVDSMSPCAGGSPDAAWNTVMEDVDQMRFRFDSNPASFCAFTSWIFGVDNITVEGMAMSIGTNYCAAAANSTGSEGEIGAFGSDVVADDDLTLTATALPANQFGIFVTSRTQAFLPGAGGTSNGNLCLGGSLGRFGQPQQIFSTGAGGEFSLAPSLAMFPQGGAFVSVVAGDSWSFQAWHRDVVGLGSNFTDGVEVTFQ